MTEPSLSLIVVRAADIEQTMRFYRALGSERSSKTRMAVRSKSANAGLPEKATV